jgi:hypothetical protein
MTKPAIFTQGDVTKALKGVKAAGGIPQRIEIDRFGKIVVLLGNPTDHGPDETELDRIIRAQREQTPAKRNRVQGSSR